MKKILAIVVMCFVAGIVSLFAKETNFKSQGRTYKVTVTYTVSYQYKDPGTYEVLVEGVNSSQKNEVFLIYAETPDEAEIEAKDKCFKVCSDSGRMVGKKMYNGKQCLVYEVRRIEKARVEE